MSDHVSEESNAPEFSGRFRVTPHMSLISSIAAITDGNPGAVRVCVELISAAERIDPDNDLGPWAPVVHLDSFGIYGSRIWMLFKDICRENLVCTLATLRACQLGFVSREALRVAIDGQPRTISPDRLLELVRARLPRFGAADGVIRSERANG